MRVHLTKGPVAGSAPAMVIGVLVLLLLAAFPGANASNEQQDQKPQKPRFETTSLVLLDNKTGLMWSLDANVAERTLSWDGARDYAYQLGSERYAGFRDWRVPTREELDTLVGHVRNMGYDGKTPDRAVAAGLRSMGFRNVQPDGYWTATSNLYVSAEAWYFSMSNGASSVAEKTLYFSLWPVRSARK